MTYEKNEFHYEHFQFAPKLFQFEKLFQLEKIKFFEFESFQSDIKNIIC